MKLRALGRPAFGNISAARLLLRDRDLIMVEE
jgi:hypothetical protein